ncbi:MAG: four helix bundle protein [Armatimonadota bacterium]|jgi:four helix bundle protein
MTGSKSSHEDLQVWQKAMDLTVSVYELTDDLPKREMYGLTSQMRNCAASVPANIAEGRARRGPSEFRHFLYIAAGSLAELETFIELSRRLGYASEEQIHFVECLAGEVGRMLYGLIRAIARRIEA